MSTPKKRTLTEELQSVMRAHALDAPDPAASIESILARTVSAGAGVPVRDTVRRRWFTPMRVVLASAAAAAVVAAIGVPVLLRSDHHAQSTSAERGSAAALSSAGQDRAASTPPSLTGGNAGGLAGSSQYDAKGTVPQATVPGLSGLPACGQADLRVTLVTTGVQSPTVAVVRVTNTSSTSCLISGFPDVHAVHDMESRPSAAEASVTPGAVAEPVPTLVLAPGTSATAAVDASSQSDQATTADMCDVTDINVTVPNVAPTAFPFSSTHCTFTVHPFVAASK